MIRGYPKNMRPLLSVLLVFDDADARRQLKQLIARRHIGVTEAESARQARAAVKSVRFDLVICAESLPDADGASVTASARAAQPGLRTVLISRKPIDRAELAAAVEQAFRAASR